MHKIIGLSLLISIIISLYSAQELRIFRLSDMVGDTIDFTEREQYSLFPGITDFESARILVKNDSNYYAEITSKKDDTLERFFLKLTSKELERIVFCINNSDTIKKQIASDEYAGLAYQRFWTQVESKRHSNIEEKIQKPSTAEEKFIRTVTGTAIGSGLGGCVGSYLGIYKNQERKCLFEIARADLFEELCWCSCNGPPSYWIEHQIFWSASILGTCAGAIGGYKIGERAGQRKIAEPSTEIKSNNWSIGCAIASAIPGIGSGILLAMILGSTRFLRIHPDGVIENDPDNLTVIPAIIAGAGMAIDIIYLGYRIGRSIDRKKAAQAVIKKKNIHQKFCDSEKESIDSDNNSNPLVKSK